MLWACGVPERCLRISTHHLILLPNSSAPERRPSHRGPARAEDDAVPRRVDHEERRRQITDALLRIASTRGLQAVTMREVAAEAGVSLRLVQYYATDKHTLLLGGLAELAARLDRRVKVRAAARGGSLTGRGVLEVVLGAVLPDDEQGRLDSLAWSAFHAAGLTDRSLREQPVAQSGLQYPNALED